MLYTKDTVLVAATRENLQHIANESARACDSMRMKINNSKSKMLAVKEDQKGSCEKVRVSGVRNA